MRVFVALFVFTFAFAARAEGSVDLAEGAILLIDKGRVTMRQRDRITWSFDMPGAGSKEGSHLEKYDLAGGHEAVHARAEIDGTKASEAVFLKGKKEAVPKVIWKATTGLQGDVGERASPAVRFDDLDGDGLPEIAIGEVTESVRLCSKEELPLLFRKVWDLKKSRFRSVLARRPGLDNPTEIEGSWDPGDGPREPRLKQILPAAVSRTAGDKEELIMLTKPRSLVDRDPKTAWFPVPENGAGEFASFDILVKAYGLTRIGIRPIPEDKKRNRYDRPRSLLLVTENRVLRLSFKADPLEQPTKYIWFDLPAPDQTSCLSLVVETTYNPSRNRFLALADMVILTEVDGEGGLKRLARDLSDEKLRRQAAILLERAGASSVPVIEEVWPNLDWQGKQRAVTVLANAAPVDGAVLLAEAAVDGDPAMFQTARRGLKAAGEAAVEPLARYLESTIKSRFIAAVELLSTLETNSALGALAAAAGKGEPKRRALLRSRISTAAGRAPDRALGLWGYIKTAYDLGEKERLLDLARAGAGLPSLSEGISELAERLYEGSSTFADRYRTLEIMGQLGCYMPRRHLIAAAKDPDYLIRAVALSSLATCIDSQGETEELLRQALGDDTPEVRLAALKGIGLARLTAKVAYTLQNLAVSDPWPEVRALCTVLARYLPKERVVPLWEQTQKDVSKRVRAATIKSAASVPGDRTDRIIEARLQAEDEVPQLKRLAAKAAGARCQTTAVPALFQLLRKGAEPFADHRDMSAAVAAARAMGKIGGDEVKKLLKKARRRSNPVTDNAIDTALKAPGKDCHTK